MTHYLLSVYQPSGPIPSPEILEPVMRNVAALNREMKAAGVWVIALNRAVAVAEVQGAEAALALVNELNLDSFYVFHAIRADLLRRLGRGVEAARAYEAAVARSENQAERDYLRRRREELGV